MDSAMNERSSVSAFSPKHTHREGERQTVRIFLTDLVQLVDLMSCEEEHAQLHTIKWLEIPKRRKQVAPASPHTSTDMSTSPALGAA